MYKSFYGLGTSPFQISTDPTFLWLGEKHREAIAMLKYGIQVDDHTGMVLLTGDTGTGKTTLINALFKSLDRTVIRAAIKNPSMSGIDFFNYIAASFGNNTLFVTKSRFLLGFEQFLNNAAAKKRKVLLVIDEAQVLTDALLNEIRLLGNFEKDGQSLIHIFLVGQQELREHLTRPANKALTQRITLNYHIEPLIPEETREYIQYRLQVAGTSKPLFSSEAIQRVHRFSRGLPRQINILCDHALLTGYVKNLEQISGQVIDECAGELSISRFPEPHTNQSVTELSSDHKDPGPEPVSESQSKPVPPASRPRPASKAILKKERTHLTEEPSQKPAKPSRRKYLLIIAVAVLISLAAAGLFFF
ncbi:AAA family ATPase [Desulfotignum phosphitoxidans]|uniref:Type II secretory pathway, component ExeA n=1 Tax=Desulfotignum phosphitoxidans DSM 13687 TaxID=1286635 RepID=S0G5I5_9BACT|nr:AAA family ATPase [Desulfotignum phosphitoxidans]EMS79481.1 type II secretory pathway, component ExeA [Desulfotignum phosphitoxidans DSM 13687]